MYYLEHGQIIILVNLQSVLTIYVTFNVAEKLVIKLLLEFRALF